MNRFFFIILFSTFFTSTVFSQNAWEDALCEHLTIVKEDLTPDKVNKALSVIERIAVSNPEAWAPNYYAAWLSQMTFYMSENRECEPCLEKMDKYLQTTESSAMSNLELSETKTLRASYYQSMLNIYPMKGASYGPKVQKLLNAALKLKTDNPRSHTLLAYNFYYTPRFFGGSTEKALKHSEQAMTFYAAEESTDMGVMTPSWGKSDLQRFLEQIEE